MSTNYQPNSLERARNRERLERKREDKREINKFNSSNPLASIWTSTTSTTTSNSTGLNLLSEFNVENRGRVIEKDSNLDKGKEELRIKRDSTIANESRSINRISRNSGIRNSNTRLRSPTFNIDFMDGDDELDEDEEEEVEEDLNSLKDRGRGRTRKREEDPAIKKSYLEDALRSSLVTLLSFTTNHQSLSYASLTSLLSPTIISPFASPFTSRPLSRNDTFTSVISASSGVRENGDDDEEELQERLKQEQQDSREWEEDNSSAESLVQVDFSSSTDDITSSSGEGTQLPSDRSRSPSLSQTRESNITTSHSKPIQIPSSSTTKLQQSNSSQLDSLQTNSLPIPITTRFSPMNSSKLNTTRLGQSFGETSTRGWSERRRRKRRSTVGENNQGRIIERGRSLSPESTLFDTQESFNTREERIRERMISDLDDEKIKVDEDFRDLVDVAVNFMNLSSTKSSLSFGSSTSTLTTKKPNSSIRTDKGLSSLSKMILEDSKVASIRSTPTENILETSITDTLSSIPSTTSLPLSDPFPVIPFSEDEFASTDEQQDSEENKGKSGSIWKSFTNWFEESFEFKIKVWHLVSLTGLAVCVGLGASAITKVVRTTLPPKFRLLDI